MQHKAFNQTWSFILFLHLFCLHPLLFDYCVCLYHPGFMRRLSNMSPHATREHWNILCIILNNPKHYSLHKRFFHPIRSLELCKLLCLWNNYFFNLSSSFETQAFDDRFVWLNSRFCSSKMKIHNNSQFLEQRYCHQHSVYLFRKSYFIVLDRVFCYMLCYTVHWIAFYWYYLVFLSSTLKSG